MNEKCLIVSWSSNNTKKYFLDLNLGNDVFDFVNVNDNTKNNLYNDEKYKKIIFLYQPSFVNFDNKNNLINIDKLENNYIKFFIEPILFLTSLKEKHFSKNTKVFFINLLSEKIKEDPIIKINNVMWQSFIDGWNNQNQLEKQKFIFINYQGTWDNKLSKKIALFLN